MELMNVEPYSLSFYEKEDDFLKELNDEFKYQYDNSSLFRKICIGINITPNVYISKLEDLPFLPVQYFKEVGDELKIDKADIHRNIQSSATSGIPSTIAIDNKTSKRQIRALSSVLGNFIGKERRPFFVCDVDPNIETQKKDMAARVASMQGFLSFSTENNFIFDNAIDGKFTFSLDKIKKKMESATSPITICGFTSIFYLSFIKKLKDKGVKIKLPKGSTVIHIGGWKKLESERVDRDRLLSDIKNVLGINSDCVVDIYGFTEQMGTLYAECENGYKHCPVFSDLIVRDPVTMKVLRDGETGIGQFFSLVPHSYPGFSLLTDDLVRVHGREQCKCGRSGTHFEVIGRTSTAEIRGCGDVLAEKVINKKKYIESTKSNSFLIEYSKSKITRSELNLSNLKKKHNQIFNEVQLYSVDDIIGILHSACNIWDTDPRYEQYKHQGLAYIISWIRSGQLQSIADLSLRGNRAVLDDFCKINGDIRNFRALPRGIVVHWLAGNVPTLGFISLLLSIITKNTNIIKLPSGDNNLLAMMVDDFRKIDFVGSGGNNISGNVIFDSISLVYVSRDSHDNEMLSKMADIRIAWGGSDAVKSIMALSKRYDADDLIFGPKISFACIGVESLQKISKAKRVARNVAVDCSVFDQEACASAHNIFVETGGSISPQVFAELISEKMIEVSRQVPRSNENTSTIGNVKSARLKYYLEGTVISPEGYDWTVLYRDKFEWSDPVYGRTVFVHPVDDLKLVSKYISRDNQVVGLALPASRRNEIAEIYAQSGVDRITQVGHMADFTSPWDGLFPIDRLVRWVSMS